jgi:uncharacterized Zn finger protein
MVHLYHEYTVILRCNKCGEVIDVVSKAKIDSSKTVYIEPHSCGGFKRICHTLNKILGRN